MTLAGIDVSAVGQGPAFPWESYRGKISFAGIKVSENTGFTDPDAARNITGARSIRALPMAYHFLHASASGTAQADWFLARCKAAGLERGELLALDAEQGGLDGLTPAQLWTVTVDCAAAIHGHFGCWPVIYTDISLAAVAPSAAGNSPLWLANPSGTPVSHIGPWQVLSFEQTGQTGIDLDRFYGDAAQLAKLAIPPAPAPPPPVKPPVKPPVPVKPTMAEAQAALDVLSRYVG
jgi:GH25 family lysozyme M1 (1,4-beta-N-acetylmuramidase)